jgi:hypothetical protein
MATINDKAAIDEIIKHGGEQYPDEPKVLMITEYTNNWGGRVYGVTFEGDNPTSYIFETEFIHDPKVIWIHPSINVIVKRIG